MQLIHNIFEVVQAPSVFTDCSAVHCMYLRLYSTNANNKCDVIEAEIAVRVNKLWLITSGKCTGKNPKNRKYLRINFMIEKYQLQGNTNFRHERSFFNFTSVVISQVCMEIFCEMFLFSRHTMSST